MAQKWPTYSHGYSFKTCWVDFLARGVLNQDVMLCNSLHCESSKILVTPKLQHLLIILGLHLEIIKNALCPWEKRRDSTPHSCYFWCKEFPILQQPLWMRDQIISIKCLLQTGQTQSSHMHPWVKSLNRKCQPRYILPPQDTRELFSIHKKIGHATADVCSWVHPVFTCLSTSIIIQSCRLHTAHKPVHVLIHSCYFLSPVPFKTESQYSSPGISFSMNLAYGFPAASVLENQIVVLFVLLIHPYSPGPRRVPDAQSAP